MSKKLLSLFLAVVMLALAVPAAVLPAFAAEDAAVPAVTESFSTKTDYTAKNLLLGNSGGTDLYDDTAYFLRWYDGETVITADKTAVPENAVAKINPELIKKGIISENDTFESAFNKWWAYMQKASSVTFKENWAVGNIDNTGTFAPMTDLAYLHNEKAFNLTTDFKLDAQWDGNRFYVTKAGSDNLYKGMYNRLNAVISASKPVKEIAVSRSAALSGNAAYVSGYAYDRCALSPLIGGFFRLSPGSKNDGAKLGAVQWTSTYTGYATIKLDELHRHSGAETDFAVYHNGTRVTNFTIVTDAATANAAIGDLEIPVFPGDTIALVFARTSVNPTLSITATVEVDTSRVPPEKWSGSAYNATMNTNDTMGKYFFSWFEGETEKKPGQSVADTAVVKVNPYLIENGIVSASDTVKQAFDKWVAYMKETAKITYNGAWSIDNVAGSDLAPIAYYAYLNDQTPFHLTGSEGSFKFKEMDTQYWVTESGIDRMFKDMWNRITGKLAADTKVGAIDLKATDVTTSKISPFAYETGSMLGGKTYTLIPASSTSYTVAYTWTAYAIGCADITVESISGGNVQFNVLLNGTPLLDSWMTINLANAGALDLINETIASLEIPVLAGDKVSLAFDRVAGAYTTAKATINAGLSDSRLHVVYMKGENVLKSVVVNPGDPLPKLTGVSDFGKIGYLINNKFTTTLPETVEENMLIEDCTVRSSASITINNRYSINVYVHAGEDAIGAGIIVDGRFMSGVKQADGSYKVTAATVGAGKLQSAAVSYQAYEVYEDGYRISTAAKTVTAMDLLNAYVSGEFDATTKALAQGVMDYAEALRAYMTNVDTTAAVKTRIRGDMTIPGVALSGKNSIYLGTLRYLTLGGEYPKYISANQDQTFVPDPTVTEADKVKMGYEEGVNPASSEYKYAIKSVTLNLEDQIGFAFRIVANGSNAISDLRAGGKYALRVEAGFNTAYYDAFLYEGDERGYKSIVVDGVPASRYDQDMEFTLVEKQADGSYVEVGATLTYSVKAYAVQTFRFGDWGYIPLLAQALFNLGNLADAYVAAHA